ncbi:response regulator transcription factor [Rhodopirellula sallentina]|uniref:Two component LuxR family transcriptional regulator n=1 Tax=Rhodopirellula sallentina SM41 TaxID=1263870 RepID=M5U796_9BACT|nr:response regulator [Rhodopirellula sallentina]EMI57154.1 two component LuxR family transcriptional regulator [Rhodopirellula sallentina SM41]
MNVRDIARPLFPEQYSSQLSRYVDMSFEMRSTVYVVDDDEVVLRAVVRCLEQVGHEVVALPSAESFLEQYCDVGPGCLVLDLCLAGMSGHALQEAMVEREIRIPILFMSGNAGIQDATKSLRLGAVDFLEKPLDITHLKQRVADAIEADQVSRSRQSRLDEIGQLIEGLSPREREIMYLVVDGLATKNIASRLDISPKTVEVHRSKITKRMKVESVAQLVAMVTEHRLAVEAKPGT